MMKNKLMIKSTMLKKINFTKTMKKKKKKISNRHIHKLDRKDLLNQKQQILGNKKGKIEQNF